MSDKIINVNFDKASKQKEDKIDWDHYIERAILEHPLLKDMPANQRKTLVKRSHNFFFGTVGQNNGQMLDTLMLMDIIIKAWKELVQEIENDYE